MTRDEARAVLEDTLGPLERVAVEGPTIERSLGDRFHVEWVGTALVDGDTAANLVEALDVWGPCPPFAEVLETEQGIDWGAAIALALLGLGFGLIGGIVALAIQAAVLSW